MRQLEAGLTPVSGNLSSVDVVRHQVRKAVEPEKATVSVVGVKIRVREVRNNDFEKAAGPYNSGQQIHQLWKIGDVLKEMIGIDRLHGCRWHLLQHFIDISHNIDALMVQCVNTDRFRMSLASATTKLQGCTVHPQ